MLFKNFINITKPFNKLILNNPLNKSFHNLSFNRYFSENK